MNKIISRFDTLNSDSLRTNKPEYLILHSTKNYPEFEDVLRYHKEEKAWSGMGYHLFISESGKITQGRPYNKEAAHALGFNTNSIGLCIYSSNGKLTENKVNITKGLIKTIEDEFPNLNLLSHTQAQVKYNNKLLKEYGINERFSDTMEIIDEKKFEELKLKMSDLAGKLNTDRYAKLKNSLKTFKNCPGEMFYLFT